MEEPGTKESADALWDEIEAGRVFAPCRFHCLYEESRGCLTPSLQLGFRVLGFLGLGFAIAFRQ